MVTRASSVHGLDEITPSPVPGLFVLERRHDAEGTVIMVHGGLDRGGSFARLARRLARHDVVTYDRRGYQRSRGLGPLSLTHHVEDLVALARRESPRLVSVLGHSYGGIVALRAAELHPELFRSVVVYEAPMPWLVERPGGHHPLLEDPSDEAERFFRRMVSDNAWDRLGDEGQQERRADGPALMDDLLTIRGPQPISFSAITVPALYAHGDGPNHDYMREVAAAFSHAVPHGRSLECTNAGHGAHLTRPDFLASLLEGFTP